MMQFFVWGGSSKSTDSKAASSASSASFAPKAAAASDDDKGSGGVDGQLIELLKLLLNPAALISADAGAATQILDTLLASDGAPASSAPASAPAWTSASASASPATLPKPDVSGRKVALSSMVLTAAQNDPEFLKRVGLVS